MLKEVFNMHDDRRILVFKNKPLKPVNPIPSFSPPLSKPQKPARYVSQNPIRTLDAPDILDDWCFNLLDWGSSNLLALALNCNVHLWDGSDNSAHELGISNEENQPISTDCLIRALKVGHGVLVGSMDWNGNEILTTGGSDGKIINNDLRARSHAVETYRGHRQEVSAASPRKWVHKLDDHNTAAVRALAWCPFQANLLASGGGDADSGCCINFWDTHTGSRSNVVYIDSELKRAELTAHQSRVLYTAQSPNGCTVACASGDEMLTFWNVSETFKVAQVVSYLCKNKADVGAAAMDDTGTIHFAAQKGHLEVDRIVLSSGISVKSITCKGMTSLHYAVQGSHLELVEYLKKEKILLQRLAGKTLLDLASSEEVRSLLVDHGKIIWERSSEWEGQN
ncbi:Ankyrin repeat [Dillenia turbinata]|uniref:Ankyrin repeat n=1 Tax=Dillenia turbinata TaxID=194707 RepID=A0AAN8ZHU2_9MAGN